MRALVEADEDKKCFLISGREIELAKYRKLRTFFSRERATVIDNKVSIDFSSRGEVATYKEIERAFNRSKITLDLDPVVSKLLERYQQELENFNLFSISARKIRNNEIEAGSILESGFKDFENTLEQRFARPLYPMQLLSAYHLAFSQHACNFAVPGAGKTAIVLGAFSYLNGLEPSDPKRVDKLLIIGPKSSFAPWETEYQKCFGEWCNSTRVSGGDRSDSGSNTAESPFSTSLNGPREKASYFHSRNPSLMTLVAHGGIANLEESIVHFMQKNKTLLVVDEAHRIKNPDGLWGNIAVEISKYATGRVILTGTPLPQGYQDIYNLIRFLYPHKFEEILRNYRYRDLEDLTLSQDADEVKRVTDAISPFFIRIKKSDLGLPPATEHPPRKVKMDDDQRRIYDFIEKGVVASYASDAHKELVKAKLIRLRQAAINPSLLKGPIGNVEIDNYDESSMSRLPDDNPYGEEYSGISDRKIIDLINNYAEKNIPPKFLRAKEIIDDVFLDPEGKIIIWTIFIENAKRLQEYLFKEGVESRLLIGEIDNSEREETIREFNDPEHMDFRVVIANPFSVAESISLHKGCHNALYIERDYNCANFAQSKDRIHRYGLQEGQETNYYYLLSEDSVDELIHDRLGDKMRLMEEAIDQEMPLFKNMDSDSEEANFVIQSILKRYQVDPS